MPVLLNSAELASLKQAHRTTPVSAPFVQVSQGSSQPQSTNSSSTWQPILSEPATQAVAAPSPPAAHVSMPQCAGAAERLGSWGQQSQRDSPGCGEAVERLSSRSRESPHAGPTAVDRQGSRGRESSPKGSSRAVDRMGSRGQGRQSGSPRSGAAAAAGRQWELSLEERLYSEHRRRLYQGQVPEVKPGSAMLDDSDEVSPTCLHVCRGLRGVLRRDSASARNTRQRSSWGLRYWTTVVTTALLSGQGQLECFAGGSALGGAGV